MGVKTTKLDKLVRVKQTRRGRVSRAWGKQRWNRRRQRAEGKEQAEEQKKSGRDRGNRVSRESSGGLSYHIEHRTVSQRLGNGRRE